MENILESLEWLGIEYDDNLAKQITSFMIQQSYQSNNNNFADEDDMYSF